MRESILLETRVTRMFEEKLNVAVPSVDTDLFETGALDSLSFVGLMVQLEEDFGVTISMSDLELENFRSVARITQFIANRIGHARNAQVQKQAVPAPATRAKSVGER